MEMGDCKKKGGFTVIEVVLVLGIAGLIFLMVFIAFPALGRSQRDSQRRDDISVLLKELKDFQTNNRGGLPTGVGTFGYGSASGTTWSGFYHDYLSDKFEDPSGGAYVLEVARCAVAAGASAGTTCNNEFVTLNQTHPSNLLLLTGATCDGQKAVATKNPRKVAVQYALEGGGIYCANT